MENIKVVFVFVLFLFGCFTFPQRIVMLCTVLIDNGYNNLVTNGSEHERIVWLRRIFYLLFVQGLSVECGMSTGCLKIYKKVKNTFGSVSDYVYLISSFKILKEEQIEAQRIKLVSGSNVQP